MEAGKLVLFMMRKSTNHDKTWHASRFFEYGDSSPCYRAE